MSADPMPLLIQGDARRLPLADESVDLIVTSPPYFSLRSYSDGGEHYAGQIGAEPTWQDYLDALIDCTREWVRVLKPTGSCWVNLGDKFNSAASGQNGTASTSLSGGRHDRMSGRGSVVQDVQPKSLLLLPHRYAIRCCDELGLIVRQDQVWSKANSLPESVTDRTRRSHEYLFHLVKQPRYYSAVDEIREPHEAHDRKRGLGGYNGLNGQPKHGFTSTQNPLGKLPGSVWEVATQPLNVPDHVAHARCCAGQKQPGCEDGLDHYAAWPMALVRPIILGWSPRDVCTACGEGRRPLTAASTDGAVRTDAGDGGRGARLPGYNDVARSPWREGVIRRITRYICDCPEATAPTLPGVVVDPFGGTGSAALIAAMSGRTGISVDASWDYGDLIARWRMNDPKERARAAGLDPDAVARIPAGDPLQGSLMDLLSGAS